MSVDQVDKNKPNAPDRHSWGSFGRNEWAILGTNCSAIQALAAQVIKALSATYQCAYVDTQHFSKEDLTPLRAMLAAGAALEYTDYIHHCQLNYGKAPNPFQLRHQFAETDLVLVNGNHHQAKAQVLVIDSAKKSSLEKRLKELTQVQLIIFNTGEEEVFEFLQQALSNWREIPSCSVEETDRIISFFENQLQQSTPVLRGLVLAGGRSSRMGKDKGGIHWHGKEQRYQMAELLGDVCSEVYISCRLEQQTEIKAPYKSLADTFVGIGPYGAVLSAFMRHPDSAWLIAACDLPLMDAASLQFLVENRSVTCLATAFRNPEDDFPEPMISLWEPKSYLALLTFLAQGCSSLRKVLITSEIKLLEPPNAEALLNVNTPEEAKRIEEIMQKK